MLRSVLSACALVAAIALLPAPAAATGPSHRPGVMHHQGGWEGHGPHRRHHRRTVFAPFPVQPWAPQRPQIIDPMRVIGVVVGPENRIDSIDPVRQELRAQIG